jgi:hypothetical protein
MREDKLPLFEMHAEGFLEMLFGTGNIDFPSHPGFSTRWFVRGPDEQAVRALFQPRVLDAFSARPEAWVVQGYGEWLVAYRPRVTMQPRADALRKFLDEGYSIFTAFGKN